MLPCMHLVSIDKIIPVHVGAHQNKNTKMSLEHNISSVRHQFGCDGNLLMKALIGYHASDSGLKKT